MMRTAIMILPHGHLQTWVEPLRYSSCSGKADGIGGAMTRLAGRGLKRSLPPGMRGKYGGMISNNRQHCSQETTAVYSLRKTPPWLLQLTKKGVIYMDQKTACGTQTTPPAQRTYRVEDIASMLGIGRSSAYTLVQEGHFRIVRIGTSIRISKKSFDEWLDQQNL